MKGLERHWYVLMRGLEAAVAEGSGSGSGTCCSWLRGLVEAVVVLQLAEGTGSGSGSVAVGECVARLRGLGAAVVEGTGAAVVEGSGRERGRWEGTIVPVVLDVRRVNVDAATCLVYGVEVYVLYVAIPLIGAEVKVYAMIWDVKTVAPAYAERGYTFSSGSSSPTRVEQHTGQLHHTGPTSSSSSNPAPYIIVPVALIIVVICVMIYFRIRPFHRTLMITLMKNHMSSDVTTSPQAIAAVVVAIIVAIILLDLCIFRFPVGRNIRDFLVRKIPFCIAFYS
ncbi:hypothetical protein BBBOND_0313960 [Babesia bigemina]|uniref:Uncharacterized protein n=1 Tax=Babesia bigemina TaxID=5866 RepID=A0A061DDK0_BABBI|nr:hypothetical protein BBBOND_0313960 [Babesia bigemina]CDR97494.1 hypothetical protein BBBOND_0313960 [Babesia bigemina]|eukprot:XP_012769680.1 hypothetical protein BBBOND_0313960 [Babesia bigemina]